MTRYDLRTIFWVKLADWIIGIGSWVIVAAIYAGWIPDWMA